MKSALIALILSTIAGMASADGHYADLFADVGPSGAIRALAQIENPTPNDNFALGSAHFLRAIERSFQTRYAYGLDRIEAAEDMGIPFLRSRIAPNPAPKAFVPEVIESVFEDALKDLARSHENLSSIVDQDDVGVTVPISNLWLDVNRNARRDVGEGFAELLEDQIDLGRTISTALPTFRFDTADAAWLAAYTQMLSGLSELILSTDPTPAIRQAIDGGAAMDALRNEQIAFFGMFQEGQLPVLDSIAAVVMALEGQPDPSRTRAAHAHFLTAIAHNRTFWNRLSQETDNTSEFIPSDTQTSAMGIAFPQGIGDSWQAVLKDAEDLLEGRLLLPHWRLGQGAGLNISKLLKDPPIINLIGIFQGSTLAPYAEEGRLIDLQSLRDFDDMTQGNSPFFAIILN